MGQSDLRTLVRYKNDAAGLPTIFPTDLLNGEPIINIFDGRMYFSGAPGGTFQTIPGTPGVFEVGSSVSNIKVFSGLNVSDLFIVTGSTGQITTYEGVSNLTGKFLSGTTSGFTLANLSDIEGVGPFGSTGVVQVSDGSNDFSGISSFNYSFSSNTLNVNTISATIISGVSIFLSGSSVLVEGDILSGGSF